MIKTKRIDLRWAYRLDFKELALDSKKRRDEIVTLANREAERDIPDVPVVIPKYEYKKIPFTVATAYSFGMNFISSLRP